MGSDSEIWNQASVTDLELIIIRLGFADMLVCILDEWFGKAGT